MDFSAQSFHVPTGLSLEQQVTFCLQVIGKQRQELLPLRKKTTICQTYHDPMLEQLKEWRKKYHDSQKETDRLKKENEKLKKEIEKLTTTNNRYQIALFDHGNFKHQDQKGKKTKGGQYGHADTNRETREDYSTYPKKRLFAKTCGNCNSPLSRVESVKEKILLDIVIHPEIVRFIIESEKQWCKKCKKAVLAKDPQSLPFTEYGINTFMMTMILRFSTHSSFTSIAKVMSIGYGLPLSKSDVSNLLKLAATYLGKRYETLKKAIREGAVMYNDETGWLVHGQKAWMWIMANEKETVYIAGESRGKGIAEEIYGKSLAYAMTDGLLSYANTIPKDRHLYCWSHVLRFAYEETVNEKESSAACCIRDRLVGLYQTIRAHKAWTREQKESVLREETDSLLSISSDNQIVINIQYRVRTQKEGLILALLITEDGTNNLSERELRNMAIKRAVSHGSDTYKGMETTAIIGSIMQTLSRNKEMPFLPTLQTYLLEGIRGKHHQYIHLPYYDDS